MAEMAPLQAKDVSTFDSNMNLSKIEENGVKKGRIMCPSHNASTHKTSDCNGSWMPMVLLSWHSLNPLYHLFPLQRPCE
jgi:hypothetical protein